MVEGNFRETEEEFKRVINRFTDAIANGDSEEAMERISRLLMLGVQFNLEAENDQSLEIPFLEAYQLNLVPTGPQLNQEEKAKRINELMERGATYQQIKKVLEKKFTNVEHDYAYIQAFLGKQHQTINGK